MQKFTGICKLLFTLERLHCQARGFRSCCSMLYIQELRTLAYPLNVREVDLDHDEAKAAYTFAKKQPASKPVRDPSGIWRPHFHPITHDLKSLSMLRRRRHMHRRQTSPYRHSPLSLSPGWAARNPGSNRGRHPSPAAAAAVAAVGGPAAYSARPIAHSQFHFQSQAASWDSRLSARWRSYRCDRMRGFSVHPANRHKRTWDR